ncbi:MAG: RecX family transcriptional regulator [Bacteroidales bacterium]|nr:RecX family transcriptional regulator [Bacteroidales bacterium]
MKRAKKPITPEAARLKMADLCARSERCEAEIREKLRKQGLPYSEIDKILEFLINNKFIDNARFARSFTNDKVRFAGWGRNKIRQALALKRIPSAAIAEALSQIDEKEYIRSLQRAGTIKARSLDLEEYDDRARLYRYLITRGYESGLVSKLISFLRKKQ